MTNTSNTQFDYIIVSPHFDDALISLSQHLLNWQKSGKSFKIIKVFTRFGDEEIASENGWQMLMKSGFGSVKKYEASVRHHDQIVMKKLGFEYEYLDYIEASYRHVNHTPVYATSTSLMSGHVSPFDSHLIPEIFEQISKKSYSKILFPFGIGSHADNVILRQIGDKFKKTSPSTCSFYLEAPYLWKNANYLKYLPKILGASSYIRKVEDKTAEIIL